MTSNHKTLLGYLTVLSVLVFLITGIGLGWPPWCWAILGVTALSTSVATTVPTRDHPAPPPDDPYFLAPEAEPAPAGPQYREHRIHRVALPSCTPDYHFEFSATVRWYEMETEDDSPLDGGSLAARAVLSRARVITQYEQPSQYSLTEHLLSGELGLTAPDDRRRVMAMARDVRLALPEADRDRLEKLAMIRKNEDVWEHERNHERNKRAYLGDDVLKDPGSALVWWLARDESKLHETADLIGLFTLLSAAANNQELPDAFTSSQDPSEPVEDTPLTESERTVVEALVDLMRHADISVDNTLFIDRVVKILENSGRPAAAEEIRRAFVPGEGTDG
ncbi:hypothetical protein N0X72_08565 [Streptomyces carpaticus]|uniref:hypothetical protein n=1 Tax=Streptomyces carpaticus TaxID=285558 RepID=UPI0021FAAABE|nr:hypothetical protein N0X72_08565 [Streptomyces carpaticus]